MNIFEPAKCSQITHLLLFRVGVLKAVPALLFFFLVCVRVKKSLLSSVTEP